LPTVKAPGAESAIEFVRLGPGVNSNAAEVMAQHRAQLSEHGLVERLSLAPRLLDRHF